MGQLVVSSTPFCIENVRAVETTTPLHIERGAEFLTRKIQQNWWMISLFVLINALGIFGLHILGDSWQGWASVGTAIVFSTTILLLNPFTGSVGTVKRW
jgi:hypothetical protein